ncbi:hypothetical protein [Lysinibacillus sp. 54212]|uniref:hypothetical protein n=1 Tax=Lysinibacillus sp. 54212 TaxID=3119829 RepID=UPI002FCBF199
MKEALRFYGEVHKQYWWLHFIVLILLLFTSLFWYVLPFYIVSYGNYDPSFLIRIILLLFLFIFPSVFITFHCWFISFAAAKKWVEQKPEKKKWAWLFIFQTMAYVIVILFTVLIYSMFSVVDFFYNPSF